jgi:hypothetical protein
VETPEEELVRLPVVTLDGRPRWAYLAAVPPEGMVLVEEVEWDGLVGVHLRDVG